MGASVIFAGSKVKALKSILNLNGGADVISSTTDPTSVATAGLPGSILLNTSNGKLYKKNDSGTTTNWTEIGGIAVDNTTIQNNAGTLSVIQAPRVGRQFVAGETFAANTSFLVRIALTGETAGRVYKADNNAASFNRFYLLGVAFTTTGASAGQNVTVVQLGEYSLQSSDAAFNAADIGKPIFLTTSGGFSVTAPTAANTAVSVIGFVQETGKMYVQPAFYGVN